MSAYRRTLRLLLLRNDNNGVSPPHKNGAVSPGLREVSLEKTRRGVCKCRLSQPNQRGAGALEQRVHGGDEDVENRRVTSPLSRRFSTSYGGNGGVRSLPSHHRETTSLEFHLTPSTADDKEQQFVYLDLCLGIPATYPQTPPTLNLLQSRGLADAHLTK